MPVVQSLMDNLVRQYGPEKGRHIYYAMEAEGSGPFGPGGKYRRLHEAFAERNGVPPSKATQGKKKPAGQKARRARANGAKRRR